MNLSKTNEPISIAVIGAGGSGSQLLPELGKIHATMMLLGKMGLSVHVYDDDVVELHNIGRQKFTMGDIGQKKSGVMATRINRFYGTSFKAIYDKVVTGDCLNYNIIISCVDSIKARYVVKSAIKNGKINHSGDSFKKPAWWIDLGNQKDFSQVLVKNLFDKNTKTKDIFETYKGVKDRKNKVSCSMAEALQKQSLFINSITAQVAAIAVNDICMNGAPGFASAFINIENLKITSAKYEL